MDTNELAKQVSNLSSPELAQFFNGFNKQLGINCDKGLWKYSERLSGMVEHLDFETKMMIALVYREMGTNRYYWLNE